MHNSILCFDGFIKYISTSNTAKMFANAKGGKRKNAPTTQVTVHPVTSESVKEKKVSYFHYSFLIPAYVISSVYLFYLS